VFGEAGPQVISGPSGVAAALQDATQGDASVHDTVGQDPAVDLGVTERRRVGNVEGLLSVIENAYECGSLGSLMPTRSVSVPADG
jgi:hypothetical protein